MPDQRISADLSVTPTAGLLIPAVDTVAVTNVQFTLGALKLFINGGGAPGPGVFTTLTALVGGVQTDMTHPLLGVLPTSVQAAPIVLSVPGGLTAAAVLWTVAMVQPVIVPANFAGSSGYARTPGTGITVLTLRYSRAGAISPIGTVSFATGATAATFSVQAAVTLAIGDVLLLDGPAAADATLAGFGVTILTTKI